MTVNAPPASSGSSRGGVRNPWTRLASLLAISLVVALMTGPSGDSPKPLSGVKGSIFEPRVFWFLGGAVVLWGLTLLYDLVAPQVREAHTKANGLGRQVFALPGSKQITYALLLVLAIVIPIQLSPAAQQAAVTDIGIY